MCFGHGKGNEEKKNGMNLNVKHVPKTLNFCDLQYRIPVRELDRQHQFNHSALSKRDQGRDAMNQQPLETDSLDSALGPARLYIPTHPTHIAVKLKE